MTLLEVAVALTIAALVMASLVQIQARSADAIKQNAAAERMQAIVTAAASYALANFNQISQDPANGGSYAAGGLAIPIFTSTGAVPVGLTSVQAAGMIPSGFQATNPYGQTEWLLAIRTSTSPVAMDFLVETEGGNAIADAQLPGVAAKIGAAGGFVSAAQPYSVTNVTGVYGGWQYTTAHWTVGAHRPSDGHVAATLAFSSSPVADYLYRVALPGHPEVNQMFTDLDFSGGGTPHNITNAGTINGINFNGTNLNIDASGGINNQGTLTNAGTATFGSTIQATGTVTAQDFIISSLGNQKVSQGIYTATMAAHGDIIAKPTCPMGSSPQIFVAPSAMSDNGTGSEMSAFQAWAVDNAPALSWTIDLHIRVDGSWVNPDSSHGAAVVLTKCG